MTGIVAMRRALVSSSLAFTRIDGPRRLPPSLAEVEAARAIRVEIMCEGEGPREVQTTPFVHTHGGSPISYRGDARYDLASHVIQRYGQSLRASPARAASQSLTQVHAARIIPCVTCLPSAWYGIARPVHTRGGRMRYTATSVCYVCMYALRMTSRRHLLLARRHARRQFSSVMKDVRPCPPCSKSVGCRCTRNACI